MQLALHIPMYWLKTLQIFIEHNLCRGRSHNSNLCCSRVNCTFYCNQFILWNVINGITFILTGIIFEPILSQKLTRWVVPFSWDKTKLHFPESLDLVGVMWLLWPMECALEAMCHFQNKIVMEYVLGWGEGVYTHIPSFTLSFCPPYAGCTMPEWPWSHVLTIEEPPSSVRAKEDRCLSHLLEEQPH